MGLPPPCEASTGAVISTWGHEPRVVARADTPSWSTAYSPRLRSSFLPAEATLSCRVWPWNALPYWWVWP